MKKLMSSIKKKGQSPERNGSVPYVAPQGDGPEAVVAREVTAFCESGAPGSQTAGDEYLHLPAIVDAAESSPSAAREAAASIRRFLSKEYNTRGYAQYNAIMLTRILADNPGRRFTQNFDTKFVSTVKDLLRGGRDASVQQILRETLDYLEADKANSNDTLAPLIEMWRKEKGKSAGIRPQSGVVYTPRGAMPPALPSRPPRGLPPPDELAARVEEAKTTARLLLQTTQSTPQSELATNELVREFADRARSAHKSILNYMNCENPRPDEDTMLTLIETNDQLNIAMSKHQRAMLQARKAMGIATPSPQPQSGPEANSYMSVHNAQNNTQPPSSNLQSMPGQHVYNQPNQPPLQYGMNHIPQSQNNYGAAAAPSSQNYYPAYPPRPQPADPGSLTQPQETRKQAFSPPPGPPPNQRSETYVLENAYAGAAELPSTPPLSQPTPPNQHYRTSSAEYGVAQNPFADDAYATESRQQPQQKQYSLFDRAQHHISQNNSQQQPNSRPANVQQPTPSYIQRQESSSNNITMHGASPPPQSEPQDPVSPLNENDMRKAERQMGTLRL